ncbi:beta-galactosidase [Pontibacillus halophilus JSM 076056 = DSM 19796]|uniref:Beta-galactosidase n=1 Tax=Pontibacillus halophilus JSM 076056 = DSM 19796 TaxID=1385510 RepID=A0A0A5GS44_9BACI|nr:beta-galactosidase [Pontibacillus halophilus]KGX93975.1 beta-galactosidase [Pontibacillus halophilus JSM 076056 = DSM 19796]
MSYFGVDYYPEHWPEAVMEEDMEGIKQLGSNMVRIGEFAWHKMEPQEGQFDFSFFDGVIEQLEKKGLSVMFGTPTATFPAWLASKYPSILSKDEYGNERAFGGRRQYCFNSDVYRTYARRITEKVTQQYANREHVVVWQIDNEFGHEGSDRCFCEQCHAKFQTFLEAKYGTIDELNERYGTIFWGQTYNDFKEIPMPTPTITTHSPSLKLDWARFRSDSVNRFAHEMVEAVRQYKGDHQTITTNVSGGFFGKQFDHAENVRTMDFVSYDNYPVWGGLEKPVPPEATALALDFNRGLKQQNFWIVEELIGAQGHDVIGYLPRPNEAKMWAYQAFAHGCSNMLFFRWRGMTHGAEQFCYGVVDHDGRYGRKYQEAQEVFEDMSSYEHVLDSPIHADVAVLYDYDNIWAWEGQIQSKDFDFHDEMVRLYRPFYDRNVAMDVLPYDRDFSSYKVVVVPVMQLMDEPFAKRLREFTERGGTVLFSFRTGLKDKDNTIHFKRDLPGPVADLTGIRVEEIESLTEEPTVTLQGSGAFEQVPATMNMWRDLIKVNTAEPLFSYTDYFYKEYAAVTKNAYGEGVAYYIGGGLNDDAMNAIVEDIIHDHQLVHVDTEKGVEAYKRSVGEETYYFVMNHTDQFKPFQQETLEPFASRIIQA